MLTCFYKNLKRGTTSLDRMPPYQWVLDASASPRKCFETEHSSLFFTIFSLLRRRLVCLYYLRIQCPASNEKEVCLERRTHMVADAQLFRVSFGMPSRRPKRSRSSCLPADRTFIHIYKKKRRFHPIFIRQIYVGPEVRPDNIRMWSLVLCKCTCCEAILRDADLSAGNQHPLQASSRRC